MLMGGLVALGILLVVGFVVVRFLKVNSVLKTGIIFGLSHAFIVCVGAALFYWSSFFDPESVLGFLIFYALDFPVSLGTGDFISLWDRLFGCGFMTNNFRIPSLYFLTAGSLQYFLIGIGVGKLVEKHRRNTQQKETRL